ncbi:Protein bric-a-brac 2 [Nymphon striatum]|nr:Protein bric-a-brac 2 [Nymphon striatum]
MSRAHLWEFCCAILNQTAPMVQKRILGRSLYNGRFNPQTASQLPSAVHGQRMPPKQKAPGIHRQHVSTNYGIVPAATSEAVNGHKLADPIPSTSSDIRVDIQKIPCQKCIILRKRLNAAGKHRKDIVKRYENRITELKAQKDEKINELKQSTDIELRAKLHQANRNMKNLKRKYGSLEQSKNDQLEVKKLKLDLQAKNDIIECLEHEVDSLKSPTGDTFIRENKKKFPLMTRAFVYDALVNQVPTRNIPVLLKLSASRFSGIELATNDIPHRTTVEQMARELGIICDIQSVESIFKHENATLGFDATTQEGVHINSIHITFASAMCLVIAIDQLPGGTADDYFLHVTSSVDHLARIYSSFHQGESYEKTRNKLISCISNTMTDRVAVNHATIVLLNSFWGKTLTELNCHLHPLDSISTNVRSALNNIEADKGKLFGKDCFAGNIVLQINKMRYKDGKGDPLGFKLFLQANELPIGFIPRYRGNRLHIFFNICGKLFAYHDKFLTFLQSGTACGGLRASLREDFVSMIGITELHVCGLIGKLLTGPWMVTFYTSSANEMNHLEGIAVVQNVISLIKEQMSDLENICSRTTDFFGNLLEPVIAQDQDESTEKKQHVLSQLMRQPNNELLFRKMMRECLSAIVSVLERQYQRYFEIEVTDQLKQQVASARSHNIDAEEVMGMFSAAQKKAPNATMAYHSAKLRAQKNKVTTYLNSFSQSKQQEITDFSINEAKKHNLRKRKERQKIFEELSNRAKVREQKKHMTDRNRIEKTLKSTQTTNFASVFQDIEDSRLAGVIEIVEGRAVGRNICHVWYDIDGGGTIPWNGKIEKMKKGRKRKGAAVPDKPVDYVIAYWRSDDSYDNAEDYHVSKFQLAADFIAEDNFNDCGGAAERNQRILRGKSLLAQAIATGVHRCEANKMGSTQQFCLKWNNYQGNLTTVFETLLKNECLVDVTLVCQGSSVKAHKLVLSACSPFFEELFRNNPCKHPIIILKDMTSSDLETIVKFMYKGEVSISQASSNCIFNISLHLKIDL